jgi:hypothetical protein
VPYPPPPNLSHMGMIRRKYISLRVSAADVELLDMNILFLPIVLSGDPCPKCGRQATSKLIEFDSRTVEVCCAACGTFITTKPHLDDAREGETPGRKFRSSLPSPN